MDASLASIVTRSQGRSPGEAFGPYLVYELLGQGGMASVHRAETVGVGGFRRMVALKRMLPALSANRELVASFVREARIASYLSHANIAQTYDLGQFVGTYYIAMEHVAGHNLREILAATHGRAPLAVPIVVNVIAQICDALDHAHNLCDETGQPLEIIHRDLSPANILLAESGSAKLIDFGVAKASVPGMGTTGRRLKGKYGYMAPEYIGGSIDARADLFALGVVAHEMLTCKRLFTVHDDRTTLDRVLRMPIAPPSRSNAAVPREIDDIVMTALARDPACRWQHARALRRALALVTQRLRIDVPNQAVADVVASQFRLRATR